MVERGREGGKEGGRKEKNQNREKNVGFVRQTGTPLLTNSDRVDNGLPALCLGCLMYKKRVTIVLMIMIIYFVD